MEGIRRRIELPVNGPRALCVTDGKAFVAGYFSDDLAAIQLRTAEPHLQHWDLGLKTLPSPVRLGEQYFHDASLCFEHWQSCSTCHPDGRSDAMYWDLLNDGTGNTKNTKSLLMSALTPPVMWRGTRSDVGSAIRSGMRHIEFAKPNEQQAAAIEAYLRQMKEVPSPHLNSTVLETPKTEGASCSKCHYPGVPRGTLTLSARRGKQLFEGQAGCAQCHPHPTFTTGRKVDPGLGSGVAYDVPSLIEVWRTAPYLHSGDALTLRQAVCDYNFLQCRGKTRQLTPTQLADLLEYVKSL